VRVAGRQSDDDRLTPGDRKPNASGNLGCELLATPHLSKVFELLRETEYGLRRRERQQKRLLVDPLLPAKIILVPAAGEHRKRERERHCHDH
jgi:hypothetical protein